VPVPAKRSDYERPDLPFERRRSPAMTALRWSSVGIEFGAAVVLFFLGGKALDAKLGTAPWLAVSGSLLGVAVGTYLLIRAALRAQDRGSREPDRPTQNEG
jgi:F0F1-type ATP synthase assembly protein I